MSYHEYERIHEVHPYKRRRQRLEKPFKQTLSRMMVFAVWTLAICETTVVRAFGVLRKHPTRLSSSDGSSRRHECASGGARVSAVGKLWSDRGGRSDSASSSHPVSGKNSTAATSHWISPEQIEALKQSVSIVDVIESYNLPGFQRKSSSTAVAVCPFHNDHNPSLQIMDDNQRGKLYKCFACGAGGDVFNFVREYDALGKGESSKMSFYQAVRHVAREFGGGDATAELLQKSKSRLTEEQRQELQTKQHRLRLANTLAAEFYGKCLVSLPAAGAARQHLRDRNLAPSTVRAFAMGYAPDAYFQGKRKEWGEGSLVYYLRDKGFRPQELIDAGLATRTKRAQWRDVVDSAGATNTTDKSDYEDSDYSFLMDRFRGRLMAPIFDSSGTHVIGFGGRILNEEPGESGFKPPKYLNSPETLVFHKKNELFGLSYANHAIQDQKKSSVGSPGHDRGSIVIVEGYMDAIALWDAGIHEVVASMGTALTMEQLSAAARAVGTRGRIVLCLDNDEAGENAVERLCGGSILEKIVGTYVVEILVASLPSGVKDPADFVAANVKGSKSGVDDLFRHEVIDTSGDWTVWYINLLLSRYDPRALRGSAGSFGDVCDRISEYLSTFPNPADRIQRTHDVAGSLAEKIGQTTDGGTVSSALRIQLESDLVNMVARKVSSKESVERRIEAVDGVSEKNTKDTLARMGKGETISTSDEEQSRLSSRALRAANRDKPKALPQRSQSSSRNVSMQKSSGRNVASHRKRRKIRRPDRKPVDPPLTPHFSGFEFANKSDADWLGLPSDKWKRQKKDLTLGKKLGMTNTGRARGEETVPGLGLNEAVYFNSNLYHGSQFITDDAIDAGYMTGDVSRDVSILEHGVASLVAQEPETVVSAAEDKLLRCLVAHSSARSAMKTAMLTSDATGSRGRIEWSTPEREWLFASLLENEDNFPESEGGSEGLRNSLANLPGVPRGAFGLVHPRYNEDVAGNADSHGISAQEKNNCLPSAVGMDQDDANVPSDAGDIEKWASAYDPGTFDPENVVPEVEVVSAAGDGRPFVSETSMDGTLDKYFACEDDMFAHTYDDSVCRELRAELEVQESLATLLKASALKQLSLVKTEYISVTRALGGRETDQNDRLAESSLIAPEGANELDSTPTEDLKAYGDSLARKLRDLSETVHHLHQSAKRIGSRLLDYSNVDGLEGRLSIALQEELAAAVDVHVENLPEIWYNQSVANNTSIDRRYLHNLDRSRGWRDNYDEGAEETLEQDMSRIEEEWGRWCNDDFTWSPDDSLDRTSWAKAESSTVDLPGIVDELRDDEPLEDALSRIDEEWGDWTRDDFASPLRRSSVPSDASDGIDFSEYRRSGGNNKIDEVSDVASIKPEEGKRGLDFDSVFE